MGQIGKMIAATANLGTQHARKLLTGVTPETFGRLARPGGVAVQSNHPAFIFGHLSLYPEKVVDRIAEATQRLVGEDGDDRATLEMMKKYEPATRCPDEWTALFQHGAVCRDDPEDTIYPPMETLTKFFFDSYAAAFAAISDASDAVLTSVNPAEGRMRDLFPMLGSMLTFYLDGHCHTHLGQLSAWRRMMGMPAA